MELDGWLVGAGAGGVVDWIVANVVCTIGVFDDAIAVDVTGVLDGKLCEEKVSVEVVDVDVDVDADAEVDVDMGADAVGVPDSGSDSDEGSGVAKDMFVASRVKNGLARLGVGTVGVRAKDIVVKVRDWSESTSGNNNHLALTIRAPFRLPSSTSI